jgi:hypothetical protein
MMKSRRFWLGLLLAIPGILSALEIALVSPRDGATVPLLNDKHKAFLAMPREERIRFFADAEKRKQLIKAGYWPRPVYFHWKAADAPGETAYRILVSEKPDMSAPVAVTGENGKAKLYNLMLGRTYYWQVEATAPGEKPMLSQVRSFTTEDRPPRLLRFPDVPNVRDLGGRKTKDGMHVKQGLVFRTAGMNFNAKSIKAKDDEELLKAHPERRELLQLYRDMQKRLETAPESLPVVPYSLRSKWVVFRKDGEELGADEMKKLDTLAAVPETLFGATPKIMTANKRGRIVIPEDGPAPHTAVLMQEFDSPSDGIMQIASGGNWYWCVRVNGQLVYDRMKGNGKGATTSNYFYFVPVRKGKNLIVVVLKAANNGGWMWCCGKRKSREPLRCVGDAVKALYASSPVGWEKGKSRVTPEGRAIFLGQFGVKSDIDLRSDGECRGMTGSPLDPSVKWFHISSSAYAGMRTTRGKTQFAKVFRVFLDEKNYPIVFHCIAGQDRTGAVAFILNGLLGVPEEELYLDWEATGFWNKNPKFNHASRFDKLLEVFREQPGKDLYEQIENYVLSCGFTREDIEKFRSIMLEKR